MGCCACKHEEEMIVAERCPMPSCTVGKVWGQEVGLPCAPVTGLHLGHI